MRGRKNRAGYKLRKSEWLKLGGFGRQMTEVSYISGLRNALHAKTQMSGDAKLNAYICLFAPLREIVQIISFISNATNPLPQHHCSRLQPIR